MTDEEKKLCEEFDSLSEAYTEKFGLEAIMLIGGVGSRKVVWHTIRELCDKMRAAMEAGRPMETEEVVLPEELQTNPYTVDKDRGRPLGAELYDYWERFHKKFPIGRSGYTDYEDIKRLIAEALESGKPVEWPKLPEGCIA